MLVLILLSGLGFSSVSADSNKELKLDTKTGSSFVKLKWNDIDAERYILVDKENNEILYEGSKRSFKKDGLEQGSFIEYELLAVDQNEKIIDTYQVTAYPDFKTDDVIQFTIGESDSEIALTWENVPKAIKYQILKDGEVISEPSRVSSFLLSPQSDFFV
ncbi:hypothetical protein ACFSTA_01145 [Ornithinibacillus salinisoli]|uniref:Fibronectin type III domain-containing protein n=1 Tax=Ornithinibacillus salinisoli TaxID=1848459 RepID=A0ABW4VTA2_9BACI